MYAIDLKEVKVVIGGTYRIHGVQKRQLRRIIGTLNLAKTPIMNDPTFISRRIRPTEARVNPLTDAKEPNVCRDMLSFTDDRDLSGLETVEFQLPTNLEFSEKPFPST